MANLALGVGAVGLGVELVELPEADVVANVHLALRLLHDGHLDVALVALDGRPLRRLQGPNSIDKFLA